MKSNIFRLFACIIFILNTFFQMNPIMGQILNRHEYRSQLLQAVTNDDTVSMNKLMQAQSIEAIRLIESLLDSAIVQTAKQNITRNDKTWHYVKILSACYADQFGDNFYLEKNKRYLNFSFGEIVKKATIISNNKRGRDSLLKGNFQAALEIYQQTLDIIKSINDRDGEAIIHGNIGVAYFYLGDFDRALEYYQHSLALLEKIGDLRRIGNRLGNIANVYSDWSDYSTALTYFDKALKIRKEIDDKRGMAADFNNTGLIYYEMGDYVEALDRYEKALALNQAIDNRRSIGKNLANIANIHINLGYYRNAIQTFRKSLVIRRELGDTQGEANDIGNLGIVYLNLGEYSKASSYFQQALSIHRKIGYREGEAYQLGRIADLNATKGDYSEAIRLYNEALKIHGEIGHVRGQAYWLEAIGKTYIAVGDFDRALEKLNHALELHRKIKDVPGEAVALNTIGQTYLETDRMRDAKNYFEQALALHRNMGEQGGEALTLGNLGSAYSLLGDSSSAVEHWNKAIQLSMKIGKRRLQGWLHKQLGNFYQERDETEKAAKAYEQGLAITEGLDDPELRWELYFGQGRLNEINGDPERAYYSYRAAISDIEDIRSKGAIEEFKSGIMHSRFEVYEAIVSVLVQMGRAEEAFEYSERARARSLLDKIGNAAIGTGEGASRELIEKERSLRAKIKALRFLISAQDDVSNSDIRGTAVKKYRKNLHNMQLEYQRTLIDLKLQNPEYSSLVTIEPFPLNVIQPLLDEKSVLLEYFISDNKILIFVLSTQKLNVLMVPEGRKSLRGKILLFRGSAVQNMNEQKSAESHWMKPMQGLYTLLIKPVHSQGLLSGKNHLIIAPQGLLHYIPFHALISRIDTSARQLAQPHFLVEDYLISYTPSASVLKYCCKNKATHIDKPLLLAPKPAILPFSEQEVAQIANELGSGAEYWLGENATETLLKKQCRNYSLLHFATTARFNKVNPLFSRLDLAPSETDDGSLDVFETFGLNLMNANLVTLSACETALGSGYTSRLPQGDDLVSLTRAFLYAGTPSVIASLWEVYDTSTALFMHRFYQHLKTSNKVEALALTQRDMIGKHLSGDNDYTHPYFWAPFVLIGDWKDRMD